MIKVSTTLFLVLLLSTYTYGQDRPDKPNNLDIVNTGSGTKFELGLTRFSSAKYHHQVTKKVDAKEERKLEQAIHQKRKHYRIDLKLNIKLQYHNYTDLSAEEFGEQVAIQQRALSTYFVPPDKSVQEITGKPTATAEASIKWQETQRDYKPNKVEWRDWTTFDGIKRGQADVVHVVVTDQLPDTLGHGYAQFGWSHDPNAADVVIRLASFGSGSKDFNEGKTLIHLVANHFGLIPLTGLTPCGDDRIAGTPIHNSIANFCLEGKQPTSTCDNQLYLTNNYMSHSPDACKDSFTIGQWKRMLHFIDRKLQKSSL